MGAIPSMPTNMTENVLTEVQPMNTNDGPSIPMDLHYQSRAEMQKIRGQATPPRYSRKMARKEWRKQLGDMFQLRHKFGATFQTFKQNESRTVQNAVS